ncbi:AraC family transcriptional regulator [Lactobacillus bombicola]|uniref:HTH araC/xylS-type domain-containing protein n=1 Tax=Lactobacillus bombicola TaxID=1505723 RepID=A0A396SM19_9LACO|nr:helix-turn-helix domain-containing protein [Lactobacillus bombicola]RHW51729.1 hypothetical protein DS833_02765 [Lactobacillus bombicola]RHW54854.1 hypothetical protein DS835_01720 [Lactobacillus bombicola]
MNSNIHELVQLDKLPIYVKVHQKVGKTEVAPHWHQSIELSFTLQGKIDHFVIEGIDHQTQPGEILIINTQIVHSIQNTNNNQKDLMLTLLFPYSLVRRMFPAMDQYLICIKNLTELSVNQVTKYHQLQTMLSQIIAISLNNNETLKDLELTILSYQVLEILLKHFLYPRNHNSQLSDNLIITGHLRHALSFIHTHYQNQISLQDIANNCHLARQYLQRIFHKNMGITLGKYLKKYRAQMAYQELCNTSNTLTTVAMNNGFSGIRSMNRALVANYGQPSKQIRKSFSAPHASY